MWRENKHCDIKEQYFMFILFPKNYKKPFKCLLFPFLVVKCHKTNEGLIKKALLLFVRLTGNRFY